MEFKSNSPLNFNDFAVSNAILEQVSFCFFFFVADE